MNDLSLLKDEELALLSAQRQDDAFEELSRRYEKGIRATARQYYFLSGEEDLVQEGMLGLFFAAQKYDAALGVSFKTYAYTCVKNAVINAVKKEMRVPFADVDATAGDEPSTPTPEDKAIENAFVTQTLERIRNDLSDFEKDVFDRYVEGYRCKEIAADIKSNVKKIDNAIQRIKKKAAQLRPDGD